MKQLSATLTQPGAALGKQRIPAPSDGQLMGGLKGAGSDIAFGQDAAGEDLQPFMVPDRLVTPLPAVPAAVPKPIPQVVLPEIERLPIDGLLRDDVVDVEGLILAPATPELKSIPADVDVPGEAVIAPARSDAVIDNAQLQVALDPLTDKQTPVAHLRSTLAQLDTLRRQLSDVRGLPVAAAASEHGSIERSVNSNHPGGPLNRLIGTGFDGTPVASASSARFQSILNARIEPHRHTQARPPIDIRTAGIGNAKLEASQTGHPEIKVTVLNQETHFGSAPTQNMQLAEGLAGRSGAIAQFSRSAAAPANLTSSPAPALRVLHLHLEPAELGGVVVKMQMKGEALIVQLQPQLPQTALLLRSDSAALNSILQAAGVLSDNSTVQITDPTNSSNGPGNGNWTTDQNTGQSGSAQRGNADAGDGQRTGVGEDHDDAVQKTDEELGDAGLSGGSGELYL